VELIFYEYSIGVLEANSFEWDIVAEQLILYVTASLGKSLQF